MTFKRVWETRFNGEWPRIWETPGAALSDVYMWKSEDSVRMTLRSYVVPA